MSSSNKKTYILSPDFDYPPGSSISLGNLLSNPFSPHRPLCCLSPDKWPGLTQKNDKEVVVVRGAAHGANASVGAQLVAAIAAKLSFELKTANSVEYRMDTLRTEFFTVDPSEDVVKELLEQNPRASRMVHGLGSTLWPCRLFMITGLKVAGGFSMSSSKEIQQNVSVGANPAEILLAAGVGASADAEVGGFREKSEGMSFSTDGEVVLAYRLAIISPRGWKEKKFELDEYRSSNTGRMLGDDKEEEEGINIEIGDAHQPDVLPDDDDGDDDDDEALEVTTVPMLAEDGLVVLSAGVKGRIGS